MTPLNQTKTFLLNFTRHRYGFTLFAYLLAAALTGVGCVWFMRGFEFALNHRLDFSTFGRWCWITTPLLFLISVELIRRMAPCAAGTGIPQTIFAAKHLISFEKSPARELISPLTLVVKILALLIAVWAGASTGREGPTVHIAACIFIGILLFFRRMTGLEFDLRSAVVAGGAAGLAAAFNTPLAGVTFAIEELTVDYFSSIKDFVLLSIIVAAISAKALTGEYGYFGRLEEPPAIRMVTILLIGIGGGMFGAFFSASIIFGQKKIAEFKTVSGRYAIPVLLASGLMIVTWLVGTRVLGPGNVAAQSLIQGHFDSWSFSFPFAKILATLLT